MKNQTMLAITSLLSVLLFTFHMTDDIVRGWEPGGLQNVIVVSLIMSVWLWGALVLAERPAKYVLMVLLSLLTFVVPVVHMKGKGVGMATGIPGSSGGYFFIWSLIALGVLGAFSFFLSVRGLWDLRSGQSGDSK